MYKSKTTILVLLLLMSFGFTSDSTIPADSGQSLLNRESIWVDVTENTATIHHDQTLRNCGSVFDMQVAVDGYLITVTEFDNGMHAFCECYFDLSVTLENLMSSQIHGKYCMEWVFHEPSPDEDRTTYFMKMTYWLNLWSTLL